MDKEKLEKTNNQLETENESKVSKEDKSDKGEENINILQAMSDKELLKNFQMILK